MFKKINKRYLQKYCNSTICRHKVQRWVFVSCLNFDPERSSQAPSDRVGSVSAIYTSPQTLCEAQSGPWLLVSRTSPTVLEWLSHCVKQSVQRVKSSEFLEKPLYHCVCSRIKLYDCSLSLQSGSRSTFVLPHIVLVVFRLSCVLYILYRHSYLANKLLYYWIFSFTLILLNLFLWPY